MLIFLSAFVIRAQEVMTISATIIDAETQKPVEFVNIGFLDRGIGTVSNAEGQFTLSWETKKTKRANFLQLSSLGYETKQISIEDLSMFTSVGQRIQLQPIAYDLEAVTLTTQKRAVEKLGSSVYAIDLPAYWKNSKALGGEIATRIRIDKPRTLLHNVTFNIRENLSDSLLVRVNIYDYHRGRPGKKLLSKNIFHTISKKRGEETIPLKQHNIQVDEDIVFSIELVEVYGEAIFFEISTSPYQGISFTREVSQDRWKEYGDTAIGFNLISSYPKGGVAVRDVIRQKPKIIDLYWDASLPMANRNISEEIKVLTKYFNYVQNVAVRTIVFSKGRFIEKTFEVKNGRSKNLETYLKNSEIIGAADFSEVLKTNNKRADIAMVFTNGTSTLGALQPKIDIPVFCINSQQKANHSLLQEVSYLSGGHYVNLANSSVTNALEALQKEVKDTRTYLDAPIDEKGFVYGVVYNEKGTPIQGASVKIKGTFTEVLTDADGQYAIDAPVGEELSVKAFGMYTKDTVVGALKKLQIPLKTNTELLDEVYLETKTTSEKIATEMVDTPFGYKKRGSIGFSVYNRFTSEDIRGEDVSVATILQRMPGVRVQAGELAGSEARYYFPRTWRLSFLNGGATYPALILDDILYDQNAGQTLPPINPQTIDNILLLKTALSTVRYGQLAAYGAIVIETKQYVQSKKRKAGIEEVEVEEGGSALATGNTYTEGTTVALLEKQQVPSYYSTLLRQSRSLEEAKKKYFMLQKEYGSTISFYLETANHFESLDASFAEGIRSSILALAPNNSKALKGLAFQYEALGKLEDALQLHEYIMKLEPSEVQPYLDVARLSVATGNIERAEALYTKMLYDVIPNVTVAGVKDQVLSEFKHLVANHKSKLNFEGLPESLLATGYKEAIRIVFDWSSNATDFELQFVNPDNKFFTFSHTAFDNRPLLEEEIEQGFYSKEFIIDTSNPGRWLINMKHLGIPEKENPTYLKYTLYKNYGLPTETKEIKVINLSKYSEKVTLDTFIL